MEEKFESRRRQRHKEAAVSLRAKVPSQQVLLIKN